ncbi:hypothetical protein U1Q18_002928 [Sarracenia purpurea var. burkii]
MVLILAFLEEFKLPWRFHSRPGGLGAGCGFYLRHDLSGSKGSEEESKASRINHGYGGISKAPKKSVPFLGLWFLSLEASNRILYLWGDI